MSADRIPKSKLRRMRRRRSRRWCIAPRSIRPDQRNLALVFPLETFTALQRLACASGEPLEDYAIRTLSKAAGTVDLGADDYMAMSREVRG